MLCCIVLRVSFLLFCFRCASNCCEIACTCVRVGSAAATREPTPAFKLLVDGEDAGADMTMNYNNNKTQSNNIDKNR